MGSKITIPEAVQHPDGVLVKLPPGSQLKFYSTDRACVLVAVADDEDFQSSAFSTLHTIMTAGLVCGTPCLNVMEVR